MTGPTVAYMYSVIRVVPRPANGEFVNLGVVVTNDDGDSCVLVARSDTHLKRLADDTTITAARDLVRALDDARMTLERLQRLRARHRNVVQFSEPMPVVAESAPDAADLLFQHLIVEE